MKIETRFNIGDEVSFLAGSKLVSEKVARIPIEVNSDNEMDIRYYFKEFYGPEDSSWRFLSKKESECFASKAEFLNQLDK